LWGEADVRSYGEVLLVTHHRDSERGFYERININPAFIIVLSILGAHFAGILGFVIALPLAMTIIEIFKYLRKSTQDGKIS